MASQPNEALPAGFQLQNYRIEKQISGGGFSIVYLAYDEHGQPVAIKEYLPNALVLRTEGAAVQAISADPDNDAVLDALHGLVARVGPEAIAQPDDRVRKRRTKSEYPAFAALRQRYEADHRFLRLPDETRGTSTS